MESIPVGTLFDALAEWPEARRNYDALRGVLVRRVGGVTLTFNPARVRSTAAKVRPEDIARRPCFLCRGNRPAEQRSLSWRTYEVLVNPYPIFGHHLTIASVEHCAQGLVSRVGDMYALAEALPGYAVFFNGARCGASAPDHAHFQAARELSDSSVLEGIVGDVGERLYTLGEGGITVSTGTGRLAYHLVCRDEESAGVLLGHLMEVRRIDEGMINAVARLSEDGHTVDIVVIPRRRFRPWQYDAMDDRHIAVSPAAVEVLGLYVLPYREDYEKMTAEMAEDVLRQVCYASDSELLGK